ncbi:sigma factor-like helix-turn-helix DNA-binding protein [Modestobacter altitudinis]|uniref:sigma factor-like helix-turn-helix DNA-binding protein n=1 Tax=Modestobacter altitudinis TaxID=2213158 RepID=UPI00110CC91E|nr:sigma factor-like helix-turn-helix DNA-binding protein [Modestobacter altitudinis]
MSAGSFEEFVTDRSAGLLRTAYLLTGDRVEARDLLQGALITTEQAWGRFDDQDAATASARRQLVAAHTSWRRVSRVGDLLGDSPVLANAVGFPGFARRPTDPGPPDEVSTALARLAPQLRATLVLRYGTGLSVADTADALGSPVDTVTGAIARGLDALGTDGPRLASSLALRAEQVTTPDDALRWVREGARDRRSHRLGLLALAAVLVAIVVLVALSL